jgi:hypothetical protein
MQDREIAALFLSVWQPAARTVANLPTLAFVRNFQAASAGVEDVPTIYFSKISEQAIGAPHRRQTLASDLHSLSTMQQVFSAYQITVYAKQLSQATTGDTETDLLHKCLIVLQSDTVADAFRAAGLGLVKIENIRADSITDEDGNFLTSPSFDVTFSHNRVVNFGTAPNVSAQEFGLKRV